ncbi:Aldehyde dehydrogenase family [Musa troglodytarum]|uniref:Aldehyde dehydrogenase family n=1 Tax=Musa troglodytarum TaxID=320322 RepID=A0A9E7L710_9LILI|nr:Aldehyde dehydrogenase family [Musa troglodytarum]
MAFWWPLLVLGVAFVVCRFLLMLIPPSVPSIEIPRKGKVPQTDKVQCYEPATMKYLGYTQASTPDEVFWALNVAQESKSGILSPRETGQALVSSVDKIIFVGSPGVGKMGPPLSGRYDMGAICVQEHSEKLQNLVNDALDKGAEITFGPIIPIMKFSSDEEVIKLANDSNYGLGCAVFSGNQKRAIAIASQLHCGVAAINDFASTYMCQSLPFGGVKHSGFGRFAGVEGLRACCLVKSVVEDRWWPYIKTVIPKPIQYPVAENAFEFQQSLVEALYGLNVWDRLRALTSVVKIISEKSPKPVNAKKRE